MNRVRSIHRAAVVTFVAAALVTTGVALAHAGSSKSTAARSREMSPALEQLMERKAELGLTADQDARLASIRDALREKNKPLLDQIEAATGERPTPEQLQAMTDEQKAEYRSTKLAAAQSNKELKPVFAQLKENRKAAWQEAKTVLNEQQQAQVQKWAKDKKKEMNEQAKAYKKSGKGKGKPESAASMKPEETPPPATPQ